jgi:hypothetical protein
MDFFKIITDPYDRKARLLPALLLVIPFIAILIAYLQTILPFLQLLIPIAASCGILFLLTHLVRDKGKAKEDELFKLWKGMPSVAIFRHCDSKLDAITKKRYHKRLSNICETSSVTVEEEEANKESADGVYQAWSQYLRGQTRDKGKFHLLFQENINYGFRRNMFGVRCIGIVISLVCIFLSAVWLYRAYINNVFMMIPCIVLVISIAFLMFWKSVVTSDWVRIPADAYAERLAEAVDLLENTPNVRMS